MLTRAECLTRNDGQEAETYGRACDTVHRSLVGSALVHLHAKGRGTRRHARAHTYPALSSKSLLVQPRDPLCRHLPLLPLHVLLLQLLQVLPPRQLGQVVGSGRVKVGLVTEGAAAIAQGVGQGGAVGQAGGRGCAMVQAPPQL